MGTFARHSFPLLSSHFPHINGVQTIQPKPHITQLEQIKKTVKISIGFYAYEYLTFDITEECFLKGNEFII